MSPINPNTEQFTIGYKTFHTTYGSRPYLGRLNDGQIPKQTKKPLPFLSMYKIMPTQGEIEKYVKLQKCKGYPTLQLGAAAVGKRMDLEDEKRAANNPGKLVTPKELNEMNDGQDDGDETTEYDETYRTYATGTERTDQLTETERTGRDGRREEEKNSTEEAKVTAEVEEEKKKKKTKQNFMKRKFERFNDPPRWVMAERCFETQRQLRCKKLYWEDYSSSSDNDDFWGKDIDNVLSD